MLDTGLDDVVSVTSPVHLLHLLPRFPCPLWKALVAAHGAFRISMEPQCCAGLMEDVTTWQHCDLLPGLIVHYADSTVQVFVFCNGPRREAFNQLGPVDFLARSLLHRHVLRAFHRWLWGWKWLFIAWAGCWFYQENRPGLGYCRSCSP